MNESKDEKIVLSGKMQKEMFDFFLKTSIPRKKKQNEEQMKKKTAGSLSDGKADRSGENVI